eukprot:UN14415
MKLSVEDTISEENDAPHWFFNCTICCKLPIRHSFTNWIAKFDCSMPTHEYRLCPRQLAYIYIHHE